MGCCHCPASIDKQHIGSSKFGIQMRDSFCYLLKLPETMIMVEVVRLTEGPPAVAGLVTASMHTAISGSQRI